MIYRENLRKICASLSAEKSPGEIYDICKEKIRKNPSMAENPQTNKKTLVKDRQTETVN
jgi:hypothetical protein